MTDETTAEDPTLGEIYWDAWGDGAARKIPYSDLADAYREHTERAAAAVGAAAIARLGTPAELGAAKGAVNELLRMFHGISGGYGARTSSGRLSRLAREAGVEPPQLGPPLSAVVADELGVLQDSIGNLAAGLKLSASSSRPSKKSEIETSVADALLALLDPR